MRGRPSFMALVCFAVFVIKSAEELLSVKNTRKNIGRNIGRSAKKEVACGDRKTNSTSRTELKGFA